MDIVLWQERFGEYLRMRNMSPLTVKAYTAELAHFLTFLQRQSLESLSGLTRLHLQGYQTELFYHEFRGSRISPNTQATRLAAVLSFVHFLVAQDYLLLDVSVGLELPKSVRGLPRTILSEPETLRLLEAPDTATTLGLRDRAIMEVLYGTAIRNAELRALTLGQVDQGRRLLHIEHGKGDKARMVPLGEEAEVWLEEYLCKARPLLARAKSPHHVVFLTRSGLSFGSANLAEMVLRWAKKAGLEKHVTPHSLRHSCATHMLRRGANLRYLQQLLGHANANTTEGYTRVEISDLRKVITRCHPRERKP